MTIPAFATVADLSARLDRQDFTPSDLLEETLARIDRVEPVLNMFACLDIEGARRAAAEADARQRQGVRHSALDGIPTSIKDLIAQAGLPLRFGSRVTPDTPAAEDAPAVQRLRAAGAVLLGKSTTSEFGCKAVGDSPLTGITRNPWNPEMSPGGSSCGAAAMVAAGIVPYAIGTDGGGSIRIPAALCGLFGIKAQFGRVPVFPVSATPTLAHVGPLTRTVEDAAIVLGVIAGYDRRDPFSVAGPVPDFRGALHGGQKLRIGWSPDFGYAKVEPEVATLTARAMERLASLGHEVEELPSLMEDPAPLWNAEFYAGVGTKLRGVINNAPDRLDPAVLEMLRIAIAQEMEDYYAKVFQRYAFRETMRQLFDRFDLVASPTLPVSHVLAGQNVPPLQAGRSIVSWVCFTYPFNLTGQPAASLPVGFTTAGLPVGLQIAGALLGEAKVLSLCYAYETAYRENRLPPVC
ncbi:amidase [bacterium]|nr:amidase [bacterium]